MTTINLRLHQMHLPGRADLYHGLPWLLNLQNFFCEAGQVLSGALHLVPAPPADLSRELRRDLGIRPAE